MPKIQPFDGFLISSEWAEKVVSPAYDSVSAEQRRNFADENPENFINTMRLQEDYPEGAQPTQDQLLETNKQCLKALLNNGAFQAIEEPCLYIYQLGRGDHLQTGVVCEVAVEEYENGKLRKHENTRTSKEDLLARYQEVVGASSSPICLTYSQNVEIDNLISEITRGKPDLDFLTDDNELQRIWRVSDAALLGRLQTLFETIDATYLTDGHHRAASGRRYAEIMRAREGKNTGSEPYNQLLIALFPDNQLSLLPFHRCVRDSNGLTAEQLVTALERCFEVEKLGKARNFSSSQHGEFGMYVEDNWYRINVKPEFLDSDDPVNSLDVSLLQNLVLDPILGIKDSRDDPRLGYIAGISGHVGILQNYEQGWKVIFSCYPTSIRQLMNVADADSLMPPKSTYFDPKPRSGIFVRLK
ncbi:hypothetical protein AB833_26190 [Chromatiales bacterium (ex Bugula neritina AB1)]|nr:hypothetical protein AB833_26190 [Chromatiales bacterium (ex Bugula neritina AB1)]